MTFPSVGTLIDGFCGGLFGRDFYGPARVEGVGADWVVVRTISDGHVWAATNVASDEWHMLEAS